MVIGAVGIIWAIGATPRIAVDKEKREAQSGPFDSISVQLRPAASLRQAGVQLRVQW